MAQTVASTFAALALSFSSLQTSVVHQQAEHRQARAATDAAAIKAADKDVAELARFAYDIRVLLDDVRRRLQFPRPNDVMLPNDVQRLDYYLQNYARLVGERDRDVAALADGARKDPSLVAAAGKLLDHAHELKDQAYSLAVEGRDGAWDLRRGGYAIQAADLDRCTMAGWNEASDGDAQAQRLLSRVK